MNINSKIEEQQKFFDSGVTKSLNFRISALKKLKEAILFYEEDIYLSLKTDLNKNRQEAYMTEIHMVLAEIQHTLKHLKKWSKPKRVTSGLLNFPSKAFIKTEPYGIVLVISPWNYPFQLLFSPLVGAISGGNCVILKPSEISEATTEVSIKIIERAFEPNFVSIIPGGVDVTTELLSQKTDYIFFTGSTMVGKIVAKAAAENLTPVTLELGGKSPCIVDKGCDLKLAAKRIVWGKLLNGGQTCVAPDYLYIHNDVKEQFINLFIKYAKEFYGEDPGTHDHYCKVITKKHYDRLTQLLKDGKVIYGGGVHKENQKIHPTLLEDCPQDSRVMTEEIFGPIFPIITFSNIKEIPVYVKKSGKPLALYIFSKNIKNIGYIVEHTSSGGVCVNDVISHLVSSNLPFGGVGDSGTGAYHGIDSFKTFTHNKSVLYKGTFDPKIKFPPYKNETSVIKLLKKLL
ncbi:MAG: aldehyde dehydrogenase [Spirochaetales bacterium]|nr:aldehyde dehydrogenase [Spirochaetales bacterium]